MTTLSLCSVISRVAEPLCRVLMDPYAAYVLSAIPPCNLAIVPLFFSKHRADMYAIMEGLSVDLAGKPFPVAVAMIPADTLHELANMVAGICGRN